VLSVKSGVKADGLAKEVLSSARGATSFEVAGDCGLDHGTLIVVG